MIILSDSKISENINLKTETHKLNHTVSIKSFLNSDKTLFFWDTPEFTLVAKGAVARITAEGPERFQKVRKRVKKLFKNQKDLKSSNLKIPSIAEPKIFGGFSFYPLREKNITSLSWKSFLDAEFILPKVQIASKEDKSWITVNSSGSKDIDIHDLKNGVHNSSNSEIRNSPNISKIRRAVNKEQWREQVFKILEDIKNGNLKKVVLAQALSIKLDRELSIPEKLLHLSSSYPDCYKFMFAPSKNQAFFGATPEKLVSVDGKNINTHALASSAPRGTTEKEDKKIAQNMINNKKQLQEHDFVLNTIKEQLNPFVYDLEISKLKIRKLKTVQHLEKEINGKLNTNRNVLSLVEALHPTPAVGGLPPKKALETIKNIETFDRGWYAAPIGWINYKGDGSFVVGIRSALSEGEKLSLFAGAGIVEGSNPDEEWEEIKLKFPILDELS